MKKLEELNTVREVKETFSMIGRLFGSMIDGAMATLSVMLLIGKLITKPVEIVIALLRDIRTLTTLKKRKEEKKEAEPEKGSSSSLLVFG